jgi:RNA polymerase sigma-70 factor (ECF subfamily)
LSNKAKEGSELPFDYIKDLSQHDDAGTVLNDLMQAYGKAVWSYAFVLTQRKEVADDLMQDVFLSAFQHMHTFRGESTVRTWLLGITRNKSLNYLKSAFFRKVTLVDKVFPKEALRSAEQEMMDQLATSEIWNIVLKLPVKYREVILLEAHYAYTEQEIADLLGVPKGTVKSRLHRARAKVEKAIKEADRNE